MRTLDWRDKRWLGKLNAMVFQLMRDYPLTRANILPRSSPHSVM